LQAANDALQLEIEERKRREDEIRLLNLELEQRVAARTAELAEVNRNLTRDSSNASGRGDVPADRGSGPYAMVMADDRGKIVLVNSQPRCCLATRAKELLGKAVDILVPLKYRDKHLPTGRVHARPGARAMGAGRDLRGFARRLRISRGDRPQSDPNGTGSLGISAIVDITARKHAEKRFNL